VKYFRYTDFFSVQKLVLDALGVTSVAAVIGGSMGGMATLEWPLCTPAGYVKSIIPIATASKQSAWGISWSAIQRNCILGDPTFKGGNYIPDPAGQPYVGLATARQVAMLTYRSSISFDRRFGRKPAPNNSPHPKACSNGCMTNGNTSSIITKVSGRERPSFSAQSYLQYQGEKFLRRFDANCYLHMIDKMDLYDLTRGRSQLPTDDEVTVLSTVLASLPPNALVIGVETDLLFRPEQQAELAALMPDAELIVVPSQDGHDGFLLEFNMLNEVISRYLKGRFPQFYEAEAVQMNTNGSMDTRVRSSVFGEME
jgi:homoserine O-acetyltransferase